MSSMERILNSIIDKKISITTIKLIPSHCPSPLQSQKSVFTQGTGIQFRIVQDLNFTASRHVTMESVHVFELRVVSNGCVDQAARVVDVCREEGEIRERGVLDSDPSVQKHQSLQCFLQLLMRHISVLIQSQDSTDWIT